MAKSRFHAVFAVIFLCLAGARAAEPSDVERGQAAVRNVSTQLTPRVSAFENIWRQWETDSIGEPPVDFKNAIYDRYGLHFESGSEYPAGITKASGLLPGTKALGQNCLLCHTGTVAGQTIEGLGNATLDYHGLLADLSAATGLPWVLPFQASRGRGTIEALGVTSYFLQFRNSDLSFRNDMLKMPIYDEVYEDVPAWWNLKYKKTMFHTGSTDVRAVRVGLAFFLSPLHSGEYIRNREETFRDIKQYLLTLEPPEYPFPIDASVASSGKKVFRQTCARCHGSYGEDAEYPNKVIPLKTIGTDATLADRLADIGKLGEEHGPYEKSWLYQDAGPNGENYHGVHSSGYQAPPLYGVWATAPYFHNGSVPTIYHVLNSQARPAVYRPTFDVSAEGYDQQRLGLTYSDLDSPAASDLSAYERRKITDTTRPGRGNQGHTFGDRLSEKDRKSVLEYLKTL